VADAFALLPTVPDGRNWHRSHITPGQIGRVRAIPEGGARRDLPPDLVLDCWKNTDGFNDVMGRLAWHRPATTVRTEFFRPAKGRFLHPTADRPITVREAARLQSFPDGFVFPETHTLQSVGRQIGNALPPRLAQAIGRAILMSIAMAPVPSRAAD
jgi:DNA (cytosine-5)-methyltransferase 1